VPLPELAVGPITALEAALLPTVLVMASGRGERFLASGGVVHKLQADLGGKTVLQRTLDAVQSSGLNWHLEQAAHPGMGDSIAAAVRTTADAPGWMVLPADLPLVQSDTLLAIARAPLLHGVLFPMYQGQRGHPVRFSPECGLALMGLSGPKGAAAVVAAQPQLSWPVGDVGVVTDIDTLDDLNHARALLHRTGI